MASPSTLPPGFELDQPEGPAPRSWLARAGDAALEVAFPHATIARSLGRQAERAGEQVMSLPGDVVREGREALEVSGTHYRQLGRMVGLPLDPPAPEDQKAYQQAVIEMVATTAGGKLGKMVGTKVGEVGKYLGRGLRTPAGTERFLASQAPLMAGGAGEAQGWRTIARELAGPAVSASAVGSLVDATDPTPWELTDKPVAGAAGLATGYVVARNTIDDLLLQNPRYRDLMMRGARGSPLTTALGATLGYLLAKGYEVSGGKIEDMVDFFLPDEVVGQQPPVDEQGEIARRLLGQ